MTKGGPPVPRPRTKGAIADDMQRLLKAIKRSDPSDRERRTVLYRDVAEASVELREHFLTGEGEPDWGGRTWAYRDFVRTLYRDAGMDSKETATTQAGVRYHVGNVLRDRLPAETIEDLGLQPATPIQRARKNRAERSTVLRALKEGGDVTDTVRAVSAALALLERITDEQVAELQADGLDVVRRTLAGVRREADRLDDAATRNG